MKFPKGGLYDERMALAGQKRRDNGPKNTAGTGIDDDLICVHVHGCSDGFAYEEVLRVGVRAVVDLAQTLQKVFVRPPWIHVHAEVERRIVDAIQIGRASCRERVEVTG